MDKLLDKLSSYNLLTNLIPGSIFCYLLKYITNIDVLTDSVITNLFIYYFIGLIMSRIGSLLVEPVAKCFKIVEYADYKDYLKAVKADPKIETLVETNNTYRTIVATVITVTLIKCYLRYERMNLILSAVTPYIVLFLIFLLFLFAYRKQTSYIRKRVERSIEKSKEEERT